MKSSAKKSRKLNQNVVFITHHHEPWRTGGERYNYMFLHALEKENIRVQIWTTDQMHSWMRRNRLFHNFWYIYRIHRDSPDVVIVDHYMFSNLVIALWYARRIGKVRIIGIVHHIYWNWYFSGFPWIQKCMRFTEGLFIKQFDALLIPSSCTLKSIQEITAVPSIVLIVPPGTDRSRKASRPDFRKNNRCRLLFVGMLHRRKGVGALIQAVAKTKIPLTLSLVGTGTKKFESALRIQAARMKLESQVIFHGRLEGKALDDMYKASDIFVMPSWHEGYGIALVEAMRFGLPIIGSRICTFIELVQEGVNGLLVPPGDIHSLAMAIEKLCGNKELREKMGKMSLSLGQKTNTWRKTESQFQIFIGLLKGSVL